MRDLNRTLSHVFTENFSAYIMKYYLCIYCSILKMKIFEIFEKIRWWKPSKFDDKFWREKEKDRIYLVITFTFEYGDNSRKMGNEMYFKIATNEQFVGGQRIYDDEITQKYFHYSR